MSKKVYFRLLKMSVTLAQFNLNFKEKYLLVSSINLQIACQQ
jgi:hypothetical protein